MDNYIKLRSSACIIELQTGHSRTIQVIQLNHLGDFVDGQKFKSTKPMWRTTAILENSLKAISLGLE